MRQHIAILDSFLEKLEEKHIKVILDAGSGRTSLSTIVNHFPKAEINAIVYPGDRRKLDTIIPIKEESEANIQICERDICHEAIPESYDLIVAHLLFGEAAKFGNRFEIMLERLLAVNFRYLIIIDYLEDPCVDGQEILRACEQHGFQILKKQCLENGDPQVWKDFTGKHNFGYLIYAKQ